MGFSREQAMEALVHTNSLEQATEYCLTHQQPVPAAASAQVHSRVWFCCCCTKHESSFCTSC